MGTLVNLNTHLTPPRLANPDPGATSGPPIFTIEDMQLFHQYTTATYATLDTSPAQYPIWQRAVIDVGFEHAFVLRGMMALSALHLATGGGGNGDSAAARRWVAISSANLNVALTQFRQLLEAGVDDRNCVAVFAFSATIVVHALAAGQAQAAADPVAEMIQCVRMVKGVTWAVLSKWAELLGSVVGPLVANGLRRGVSAEIDDVAVLREMVEEECVGEAAAEEREVCGGAVDFLCEVAREGRGCPPGDSVLGIVFSWPVLLPEAFLGFLAERRPVALVILLHYTALMDQSGDFWWMSGWHQRVKEFVDPFLPERIKKWVPE
ncbi:C6 zinc finger domain-containing protein [Lasiodiplodia theobromae]|uniref:C6 zinc finger domain-containing protein n=1 Tax=Lasiodiplodia theobromae TaxID=45133 RepID=UPI0015C32FA8|nr:C6 zinc finger domain-containing protein [Lasiodiplodia theobromae]KAF4545891.1 C6 zinc finger domain-containing protein [Lasiodiplodia theobromae]